MVEVYPKRDEVIHVAVQEVTQLPFGLGKAGADRHITDPEKRIQVCRQIAEHIVPTSPIRVFDCMEDRKNLQFHNQNTDPKILLERLSGQLPGGTGLAYAKALILADAALIRPAKHMWGAYELSSGFLTRIDYEDAGHAICGASGHLLESVSRPVPVEIQYETLQSLGAADDQTLRRLHVLDKNRKQRLESGYFNDWTSSKHEDFLQTKFPHNFMDVEVKDDEVKGHYASGLIVPAAGFVFAKNKFIEDTGYLFFAATLAEAATPIKDLSAEREERALIELALIVDLMNVSNQIVAEGLDVYAQAA